MLKPTPTTTAQDRKAWDAYVAYREAVAKSTRSVLEETDKEKQARIARLLKDPKAFQEYYFPALKETPDYLIKATKRVLKDPTFFGWWMMFRGARKSTWLNVIIPLMLKARGEMKFMVLIGQNERFAKRFLSNIQANLEANHRYIADFGQQERVGSWEACEFTTTDGVSFVGLGMGQSPRGLNIDFKRPDYIVSSDLDSKELSKNPARCREMYNWLLEDVLGTFETGAKVARFVYDNNYFSETSIGHILKSENEGLDIIRVDALKPDGTPIADFITMEWVEAKKKRIGYRAFMREFMNTPIEEGSVFKADWIRFKKMLPLTKYDYLVSYCDPSFKSSKSSDFKAIVLMGRVGRELHIIRAFCRQTTPQVMVSWHYDLAWELHKQGIPCRHYIEANMIQDILMDSYEEEGARRNWWMDILPDKERKGNKTDRIEASSVSWEAGHVYYNIAMQDDPDMKVGLAQTLAFEKGSSAHDDFPDACEGAKTKLDTMSRGRPAGSQAMVAGDKEPTSTTW